MKTVSEISSLVKNFYRNQIDNIRSPTTSNTIILPSIWKTLTESLCKKDTESTGYMICSKKINGSYISYLVEHMMVTNTGTIGSVFQNKKINLLDVIEQVAIEFHSHPQGLGEHWSNNFSLGDYTTFINRIDADSTYKHVLFTPSSILTIGLEKPDFRFINVSEEVAQELNNRNLFWESITGYKNILSSTTPNKSTTDIPISLNDFLKLLNNNTK